MLLRFLSYFITIVGHDSLPSTCYYYITLLPSSFFIHYPYFITLLQLLRSSLSLLHYHSILSLRSFFYPVIASVSLHYPYPVTVTILFLLCNNSGLHSLSLLCYCYDPFLTSLHSYFITIAISGVSLLIPYLLCYRYVLRS